jgi:hypothetical protein
MVFQIIWLNKDEQIYENIKTRENMLLDSILASVDLRLAVRGSAMVWGRAKDKESRERRRITCHTRLVNPNG